MVKKPSRKELEEKIECLESEPGEFKNKEKEPTPGLSEDFKRLANRSQDAIYHYNVQLRKFIFYNELFLDLFGSETENTKVLTPKSVLLHIHPDDREKVKKAMVDSFVPDCPGGEVEYRFQHPEGYARWMHDRWIVIRDSDGKPLAIEGFIRDTTDRNRIEEELREKEKLQTVLEMAGAVCHELNNPMQVVLMGCKKLLSDSLSNKKLNEKLFLHIEESIKQMAKITNNLSNITKYETKDYVAGTKIIDINEASKK